MRICCELIAHQYFLLIPFEPTNHLEFIDVGASHVCVFLRDSALFCHQETTGIVIEMRNKPLNRIIALF